MTITGAKSNRKMQRLFRGVRLGVLVTLLAVSTVLGILHQAAKGSRPVGVDALDPFGGIEALITFVLSGTLLDKIAWSSFILLGATVVVALVFRRAFCGQICAFGALQELAGRLGRAIFGRRRPVVPQVIDQPGRYLKYLVLAVIVAGSAATASLFIRPYDPWAAWHHILSVELVSGFLVGLILLAVSLAGSVLYERFFCKYLCPMGAFLGLIHRLGWFRVKRVEATCTHCHACDKACPVGIQVEAMSQVQSAECINCNLCVEACPVVDTLVTAGPKKGKISSFAMLGITAGVFVVVMGITTALGGFEWTVKSLAERAKSGSVEQRGETAETRDANAPAAVPSAENVTAPAQTAAKKAPEAMAPAAKEAPGTSPQKAAVPAPVEPAAAGGLDPEVIKGSDTFQQVAETFGVTKGALMERFVITDKEFGGPIRDIVHREGATFEVQDVRDFVAEHLKK